MERGVALETYIVTRDCLADFEHLRAHPRVGQVIQLPRDFVLYEYYDPLLELRGPGGALLTGAELEAAMLADPALRRERTRAIADARALRAPFYALDRPGSRRLGKCILGSSSGGYWINTMRPVRWILFRSGALGTNWDREQMLHVRLNRDSGPPDEALDALLDEWFRFGHEYSSIESMEIASKEKRIAAFDVRFHSLTGPWIAALFVLLSDSRRKIGVTEMRLSLP